MTHVLCSLSSHRQEEKNIRTEKTRLAAGKNALQRKKAVSAAGKNVSKKCRFAAGKIQSSRKNTLQQHKSTFAAEKMHFGGSGKNHSRQEKPVRGKKNPAKTGKKPAAAKVQLCNPNSCRNGKIHLCNGKKQQSTLDSEQAQVHVTDPYLRRLRGRLRGSRPWKLEQNKKGPFFGPHNVTKSRRAKWTSQNQIYCNFTISICISFISLSELSLGALSCEKFPSKNICAFETFSAGLRQLGNALTFSRRFGAEWYVQSEFETAVLMEASDFFLCCGRFRSEARSEQWEKRVNPSLFGSSFCASTSIVLGRHKLNLNLTVQIFATCFFKWRLRKQGTDDTGYRLFGRFPSLAAPQAPQAPNYCANLKRTSRCFAQPDTGSRFFRLNPAPGCYSS